MLKTTLLTLALGAGLLLGASSNASAAPITGTIVHNSAVRSGGLSRSGQQGASTGTGQQGSRSGGGQQGGGRLGGFANQHPGIANDLRRHPEWAHNQFYLQSHPELQMFMSANPGIVIDFGFGGGFDVGVGFAPAIVAPSFEFVGWYGGNYWDHGRYRDARGNFNTFHGQNRFANNGSQTGNFQPGRVPGRGLSLPSTNGNTNGVSNNNFQRFGATNNSGRTSGFSNPNFSNGRGFSSPNFSSGRGFSSPNFSSGRGFSSPNFSGNRVASGGGFAAGRNFSMARPTFGPTRANFSSARPSSSGRSGGRVSGRSSGGSHR